MAKLAPVRPVAAGGRHGMGSAWHGLGMVWPAGPLYPPRQVAGEVRHMESGAGLSRRAASTAASIGPILDFYSQSRYAGRRGDPAICDLTFGNPHEFPLPGLVDAIQERAIPHNKDCTAYPVGSACARCGVGMPPGASRSCAGRSSRAAWRSFRPGSRPTRRVGTTSWPAAGRTGFVARRAATPAATFWRPAICCSAGRAGARPR